MEDTTKKEQTEEEIVPEKKFGKRILMAFIAIVASASVSLAGFFSEPAALLDREIKIPSAQVDVLVDDDDDEGDENEDRENKESFSEKARSLILRIPLAIRSTIGLAMWCIGWVLIKLVAILWIGVLAPLLTFLLRTILSFLIFAAVIAAVLKLLFPWLKLRDIFCRKNLILLLIISILFNLLDMMLPLVWDGYTSVRNTVLFVLYLTVSAAVLTFAVSRIRKIRKKLSMLMYG